MAHPFDKDFWESHWLHASAQPHGQETPANPYLARELSDFSPGTGLDAGCGEGAEAIWLATRGWQVTASDISTEALFRAGERATRDAWSPVAWSGSRRT
jgi:2-polyprenyl-3-methyl-5-hydroxy-6-metoxy-1,4-benzoquinol methylase